MQTDQVIIMNRMGVKDINGLIKQSSLYLKPHEQAKHSKRIYTQTWSTVSQAMIQKLQKIYEIDLLMFAYRPSPL